MTLNSPTLGRDTSTESHSEQLIREKLNGKPEESKPNSGKDIGEQHGRLSGRTFGTSTKTEGMFDLAPASIRVFQNAAGRLERLVSPSTIQSLTEEKFNNFTTLCLSDGLSKQTVEAYLRHLKAALCWAVSQRLLMECPVIIRMPKGTSSGKAKGRAIIMEECERMLAAVPKVVEVDQTDSWTFLLKGLWWSGLQLGEALKLSWDNPKDLLMADLSGKRPFLRIHANSEKGKKDRILPLVPEAAELLQTVPANEQEGLVFKLKWQRNHRKPARVDTVSPIICEIGKKAGVKDRFSSRPSKVLQSSLGRQRETTCPSAAHATHFDSNDTDLLHSIERG